MSHISALLAPLELQVPDQGHHGQGVGGDDGSVRHRPRHGVFHHHTGPWKKGNKEGAAVVLHGHKGFLQRY